MSVTSTYPSLPTHTSYFTFMKEQNTGRPSDQDLLNGPKLGTVGRKKSNEFQNYFNGFMLCVDCLSRHIADCRTDHPLCVPLPIPARSAVLLWMLENQISGFRIDTCRQQCWTHTSPWLGCEFATYSGAPKATELLSERQADGSAAQTRRLCFLCRALQKQHIQSFVWFTYFRKHSVVRGIYNRYFSVQGFRQVQSQLLNYTKAVFHRSTHLTLMFALVSVLQHTSQIKVFPEASCSKLRTGNNSVVSKGNLTISGTYYEKKMKVLSV